MLETELRKEGLCLYKDLKEDRIFFLEMEVGGIELSLNYIFNLLRVCELLFSSIPMTFSVWNNFDKIHYKLGLAYDQ